MPLRKLSDSDVEMLIELRKNERALWDVTFAIGLYMAWLRLLSPHLWCTKQEITPNDSGIGRLNFLH